MHFNEPRYPGEDEAPMMMTLLLLGAADPSALVACQPLILKCEEMAYRAKKQCLKVADTPSAVCHERQRIVFDYCLIRLKAAHPEISLCFPTDAQGLSRPFAPSTTPSFDTPAHPPADAPAGLESIPHP